MKKPSWTDVADAYEQRYADLLKSVMDACEAAGVANLADLLAAYDSAKKGRSVLLEEVRAWREVWESRSEDWRVSWKTTKRLEAVESATDASGALTRAKAMEENT